VTTPQGVSRVTGAWSRAAAASPVAGFADALLRGTGQVMFQNNPLTGLLFLVGIFVNSWLLGLAGLLGLVTSTATALLLGIDRALVRAGLFGFNGILVGIAIGFFLEPGPYLIAYIAFGSAASTVVMAGLANLLGGRDLPALTAPFVLVTWLLIFAVHALGVLEPTDVVATPAVPDPSAPVQTLLQPLPDSPVGGLTPANLAHALFRGIGEVMFQDSLITGVIFLAAILVNSRISAAMAAAGSAIGLAVALLLGADGVFVYHGLYGFNPLLCAIALCGVFFVATWKSALYALLAAALSAVTFASVTVLLQPFGMPALTAPFVLVTWLFLFPRGVLTVLQPVGLSDVSTAERVRRSFRGRDLGGAAPPQPA
jgi:urea transporter